MEKNYFKLETEAISQNESFLRNLVATFALRLSPDIEQINDIKTAVSEAVTNCVVHAYQKMGGKILLTCEIKEGEEENIQSLIITVKDFGRGISNISEARKPFFTTKENEERAGLGFTLMEALSDKIFVKNDGGLEVVLVKNFEKQ